MIKMSVEAFVLTLIGLIFTAVSFFMGRLTSAKNEGASLAIMRTDIEHIKDSLKDIKDGLYKDFQKHSDSIRRLHERIDEHERIFHRKE